MRLLHITKKGVDDMGKTEDYDAAIARIYKAYIAKPLKATDEFRMAGTVSQLTLQSVIENSRMGIQNEVIKEMVKEYVVRNESSLLGLPSLKEEQAYQLESIRRRIALKVGRLKAKRKRHEKMPYEIVGKKRFASLLINQRRLKNYLRLDPYAALFSMKELARIQELPYTIRKPRLRRDGIFTAEYRGKVLTQKQLLGLLGS